MEQERYQQQYKAFVQQAEQRLNELCDVYLPVKAQISRSCSRLCRSAGNAALLFPDSR